MSDIAVVWDLNGVLFKNYKLDINTFGYVELLSKKGYSQYVCTNTLTWRLKEYRSKYNLDSFFKKIYSTQLMGLNKTDQRVFDILLNDIQKDILFIDDKRKNISVASEVGLNTILYINDIELEKEFKLLELL